MVTVVTVVDTEGLEDTSLVTVTKDTGTGTATEDTDMETEDDTTTMAAVSKMTCLTNYKKRERMSYRS